MHKSKGVVIHFFIFISLWPFGIWAERHTKNIISNNLHKNKLGLRIVKAWNHFWFKTLPCRLLIVQKRNRKLYILYCVKEENQDRLWNLTCTLTFISTQDYGDHVFHHQHTTRHYQRHIWFSSNLVWSQHFSNQFSFVSLYIYFFFASLDMIYYRSTY